MDLERLSGTPGKRGNSLGFKGAVRARPQASRGGLRCRRAGIACRQWPSSENVGRPLGASGTPGKARRCAERRRMEVRGPWSPWLSPNRNHEVSSLGVDTAGGDTPLSIRHIRHTYLFAVVRECLGSVLEPLQPSHPERNPGGKTQCRTQPKAIATAPSLVSSLPDGSVPGRCAARRRTHSLRRTSR